MAIIVREFDPMTGAINTGGPFYVCRVLIHDKHELLRAWVYTTNVVLTGVVEVTLRAVGEQGPRAGSLVSEVLTNDGLVAKSSLVARYDLVLLKFAKENQPGERIYLLHISGTNSADRFDEPLIVLEYKRV